MRARVPTRATGGRRRPSGTGRSRGGIDAVLVEGEPRPVAPVKTATRPSDGHGVLGPLGPLGPLDAPDTLDHEVPEEAVPEPLELLEIEEGLLPGDDTTAVDTATTGKTGEGQEQPPGPEQDSEEPGDGGGEEDEVEATLDQILAQRTASTLLETGRAEPSRHAGRHRRLEPEDEPVVVLLRQPDEFVCSGCFLVHRRELLVDPERRLCRDCAA